MPPTFKHTFTRPEHRRPEPGEIISSRFALELDGKREEIGLLSKVDGGWIKSDVMTYQRDSSHELWRQIGKPKYEDLKFEFSMSFSDEFYKWIESFFSGKVVRKNGAIVAADFNSNELARRRFENALISEITIPALGGDDEPYMKASITPEILRFEEATGAQLSKFTGKGEQKNWSAAHFQLEIDGLGDACRMCERIDSFTIKQQILEYHAGEFRDSIRVPGLMEYPNITFYLPEAHARVFMDRYAKYGIQGEVQRSRLTGQIQWRDKDKRFESSELLEITLEGIEVVSVSADKSDVSSKDVKQAKIEICVESMKFKYKSAALD